MLRQLVNDAESQVENLTRALETLRATVRHLAVQVAMSESATSTTASGFGFGRPHAEAPIEDGKPFDFSAVAAALSHEIESASQTEQPETEAPQTASSHKGPGANVHPAPSTAEPEWYGVSDGGSWPVGPKSVAVPLKGEWAIEQPVPSVE